jgi:Xaa-Pro aminopeptidase
MWQFWLLLAACAVCAAADPEYRARREALVHSLPDSVIVVYGQTDAAEENLRAGFFQNANFRYLTGWDGPGAILLIDPKRQSLFVPERDPARERWTGRQPGPGDPDIAHISDFGAVLPAATFDKELRAALAQYPSLYAAGAESAVRLKALSPAPDEVRSADAALALLRMKKSPREIERLQRAADASVAAHLAAWKRIAAGVFEYQVAAAALYAYLDLGCERSAYAPIAGSGPNSVFLHYSRNTRRMEAGDLLLLDAGAECGGYAGDITRTAPVSGKFTARQREIYEIVLGAEKAVIAAVKPGAYIGGRNRPSLQQAATDYMNSHGKDLHGGPLGKYFTHGISHHIGLDVHDASDNTAPLQEGMVISVEPGIYIPEENIGIRVEDMVLVTGAGAKVMTAALPREAADVEKAVRK